MQSFDNLQMDQDLDTAAMKLSENHPYLGVVLGGTSLELYLIVERRILEAVDTTSLFTALIGSYFAFNMSYPKSLYPLLIFIQHFLLVIRDKQPLPVVLTKLLSTLDNLHVVDEV